MTGTVLYGNRIINGMGSGNSCERILTGVKDEARESAMGDDFQQKLAAG